MCARGCVKPIALPPQPPPPAVVHYCDLLVMTVLCLPGILPAGTFHEGVSLRTAITVLVSPLVFFSPRSCNCVCLCTCTCAKCVHLGCNSEKIISVLHADCTSYCAPVQTIKVGTAMLSPSSRVCYSDPLHPFFFLFLSAPRFLRSSYSFFGVSWLLLLIKLTRF